MPLLQGAAAAVLPRLAGLHGSHRHGPIETALSLRQKIEPSAAIAGFQGAQIGEEATALGPTEPQPGLSPLQPRARPGPWRCRRPGVRIRLSPGPAAGLGGSGAETGGTEAKGQQTGAETSPPEGGSRLRP